MPVDGRGCAAPPSSATAGGALSAAALAAWRPTTLRRSIGAALPTTWPAHVLEAVTPGSLAQVGRDLVRSGDSMHVIDVNRDGRVTLLPCASWHFEGDPHPRAWTVRATFYGPSTSTTRQLPYEGVVVVRWGSTPGQPYVGTGPLS